MFKTKFKNLSGCEKPCMSKPINRYQCCNGKLLELYGKNFNAAIMKILQQWQILLK